MLAGVVLSSRHKSSRIFWKVWWWFSVSFLNTNFNARKVTLQAWGPQRHDWTRHYSVHHPFLTTSESGLKDPIRILLQSIPTVFIPLMCSNPLWPSHQKHANVRWWTHWRIDPKIDWLWWHSINTNRLCHAEKLQLAYKHSKEGKKNTFSPLYLTDLLTFTAAGEKHLRYIFPLKSSTACQYSGLCHMLVSSSLLDLRQQCSQHCASQRIFSE